MTNQNDTQDEAERLAMECGNAKAIPVIRSMYPSKSRGEMAREFAQVFKEGYRAGQSSKEAEIASLKHDLATKSSTDLISEKYRLREQLAASRAEVERLKQELIHETKGTAYCICGERGIEREFDYICEPCGRSWMSAKQIASYDLKLRVDLREQLAAEKALSQKLVEALEIYANRVCEFTDGGGGRVFYKNGSDNPPALPFYSGEQWELGHHAEKALAAYSTDSGDGEKG